jgi:hypothetical protein
MLHKPPKPPLSRETLHITATKLDVIWLSAQRPIDDGWVQMIIENWNEDLFDDLLVAGPLDDGRYHVVEGQHRLAVVRQLFGTNCLVPCRVVSASSSPEAAEVWALVNKSKKAARQIDLFNVKVEGELPEATAINQIVTHYGLTVGSGRDGSISAIEALQKIYRLKMNGGLTGEVLAYVLSTIQATWGGDRRAYSALLLYGYAKFVTCFYSKARLDRLVEVVRRAAVSPGELSLAAKTNRMGRNTAHMVCEELVKLYNYKLTSADARLRIDEIV